MICSAIRRRLGTCGRPAGCINTRTPRPANWTHRMKDFSNASFSPDLIAAMHEALAGAEYTVSPTVSSPAELHITESNHPDPKDGENNPIAFHKLDQPSKQTLLEA